MNIRAQIFGTGVDQLERQLLKKKQSKGAKAETLTTVAITREEARRSNNRGEDRHRLDGEHTIARFRGRNHKVQVINLSGGGAMIETALEPNIADTIELQLGNGDAVECLVRWVKGGRIGLEFAHETQLKCSSDEQVELLREVVSKTFPEDSSAPEDRAHEFADKRSAARHPLIWSGELIHGSHRWEVRLRNISATGALLEFPGQLRLGSEVVLDLGRAGTVKATVSWSMGDHLGLEFAEKFSMIRLSHARPRVAPPTWLRPAYLEGDVSADSAWDETWSRLSVNELRTTLEGYLKR